MNKCYRHGELCFLKIKAMPKGIKESKTNVIETGSHGNPHTFKGGKLYLLPKLEGHTMGYFRAKNTTLLHPEHGENREHKNLLGQAKLPNGNYQILKQQEFTPQGLVPVID